MDGRNLQKELEEKLLAGEDQETETQKTETPEVQAENEQLNKILSDTANKIDFTRKHLKIFELLSPEERDQLFLSMAATDTLQTKDIDWDKVFQDSEAHTLITTILALPGRLSLHSEQDIKMVLKLHDEIGPAKLKTAWKKIGKPLLEGSFISQTETGREVSNWDRFYLFLTIGSFEQSTLSQVALLSEIQFKKIELVLQAYGKAELEKQWTRENLEDFEELEHMSGNYQRDKEILLSVSKFTESLSPEVIRHLPQETGGGSGTSSRKRPDHTIWYFQGIHGKYDQLIRFQRCLGVLPAERLDQILSVLKPSKYPVREPAENISLEQADNFLQFVQTARLEGRLNLEQMFDNAGSFSPEKYVPLKDFLDFLENQHLSNSITEINFPSFLKLIGGSTAQEIEQIKTGTVRYCDLGLAKIINWNQDWGSLLKKVDLPESGTANQLLKVCVEHHEQYVGKRYHNDRKVSLQSRNGQSVSEFYEAVGQIEEYFWNDPEQMFKIAGLDEKATEIIRLVLNGSYKKGQAGGYDLPVLEGLLTDLPQKLKHLKSILDKAKTFSTEQKRDLLSLNNYFRSYWGYLNEQTFSILEQYIRSGKSQGMAEFLENFPVPGFSPQAIEKMSNHKNEAALFTYIDPKNYQPETLLVIIDKLISFLEKGLKKSVYERQSEKSISAQYFYLDKLLPVDADKFVRTADFLANFNFPDPFHYLTNLNFDESEETLKLRIRQAVATNDFWNFREKVLPEEDLLIIEKKQREEKLQIGERITLTKQIFGPSLTKEKIKNLENLPESVWQRLKSNQKILELFMEASGPMKLGEDVLALSDNMLTNPLVWQYHLLEKIFDNALMEKALQLIRECQKQGVEDIFRQENSPTRIDLHGLTEVAKVWDENREYLQEPGLLKLFEGRWKLLQEFFSIEDKTIRLPPKVERIQVTALDESQKRKILPWLQHFDLETSWDWKNFIKWIEDKNYQLPSDEVLSVLHRYLGQRIPFQFGRQIIERCEKGEKPEEICAGLDNGSSENRSESYQWQRHRNENYFQQLQKIIGSPVGFTAKHLTVEQCEDALKMPKQELENLWKMGVLKDRGEFKYPQTSWENALYIATHRNFDLIASVDDNGYLFSSLLREIPERIHFFCEQIDQDVLQKWKKLQSEIKLDLIDSVDFFRHPAHREIIEFAGQLKEILGQKLQISAYDLLIMDVQKDLSLLRELKAKCSMSLFEENLQALAVASSGEIQNAIKKVLSILDKTNQIDYGLAARQIEHMSPGLRYAVFKNKGISAFGPEILQYKDQVKQFLSPEEWTKFLRSLFDEKYSSFKIKLDFEMASIILTDPSFTLTEEDNWKMRKFNFLFQLFEGSDQEWEELTNLAGKERLACILKLDWKELPAGFKKTVQFWQVLHRAPDMLISHWDEKPAGFSLQKTDLDSMITSLSAIGQMRLLDLAGRGQISLTADQEKQALTSLAKNYRLSIVLDNQWSEIPPGLKKTDKFWQILRKFPDALIEHWNEKPDGFSLGQEEVSAMIESLSATGLNSLLDRAEQNEILVTAEQTENLLINFSSKKGDMSQIFQSEFKRAALEKIWAKLPALLVEKKDSGETEKIKNLIVNCCMFIDPTLRQLFLDESALGRLRETILASLGQFMGTVLQQGENQANVPFEKSPAFKMIRAKLAEIKEIIHSPAKPESSVRTLFLQMYNLKQCNDPATKSLTVEQIQNLVEEDNHEILLRSGADKEVRAMEMSLDRMQDGQEKMDMLEKLRQAIEERRSRDLNNRQQTDFLPPDALTHGAPLQVLEAILASGAFCGELLGPKTKTDSSGLLGLDLSMVPKTASGSITTRLRSLNNIGYGDVHIVFGKYLDSPKNLSRAPYFSGVIGSDHFLVRCGIPSSEITAIVLKSILDDAQLRLIKALIAAKGFYIPVVGTTGEVVFNPEEFDQMKVFYHPVIKAGYPMQIAHDVYNYFKNPQIGEKHRIVMDKAYEAANQGKEVDFAVLVSYLKDNDLNINNAEWYKTASFEVIFSMIKNDLRKKVVRKARRTLFSNAPESPRPLSEAVKNLSEIQRRPHPELDNLFQVQLPYVGEQEEKYQKAVTDLLFARRSHKPERVKEISELITEQKKLLMRKLWSDAWQSLYLKYKDDAVQTDQLKDYERLLVPAVTGSLGRGEAVLGSDFDYLLLLDDTLRETKDEQSLAVFISGELAPLIDAKLKEKGIKGDAGLAKAAKTPYTKLSSIKSFKINLELDRQEEEPTEILDLAPLFDNQQAVETINKTRHFLLEENPSSEFLESYVTKDLELKKNNFESYNQQFENLYNSFSQGNFLGKIKQSLQRVIAFKLYQLIFRSCSNGKISSAEIDNIPSSIGAKVEFLRKHKVLGNEQAAVVDELLSMAYRLRFVDEIYSASAQGERGFRASELDYDERARTFKLLDQFKKQVLYL